MSALFYKPIIMQAHHFTILFFFFLLTSCSKNDITLPPGNPGTNLIGTVPVSKDVVKQMAGIFSLNNGSNELGTEFVCKVSKKKISFFSNQSGIYMIMEYGLNPTDSSLQFAGFWRYSDNPTQGLIQFSIAKTDGASDLLNHRKFTSLAIKGSFIGKSNSTQQIGLTFTRPYSSYVLSHEFTIFAHHGVFTTANPPYAQNSLNGVLNDEDYGVDALEFDVRLTKDHVPICVHNKSVDILLTEKSPLSGDYSQYSFAFLQNYIQLVDGQRIPSVEEVLKAFIDSTDMKYMWLDIKGDPDIFKYMEPVIRNAYAHAAAVGRNVVLIADIPSKAVIDEFNKWPSYGDLPTMCELSLQDAIDNGCEYFGPRYTLGLLIDDVNKAHSMGIKVYSWTLNDQFTIHSYLQEGKFDGFITDYPAYAVYDYYTMF
jgi:glycerophosphoryl diester phosphodiesterase